jgi:hypothetical protein
VSRHRRESPRRERVELLGSNNIKARSPRIFPSRRSLGEGGCSMCGPHFCSMKITEDARK